MLSTVKKKKNALCFLTDGSTVLVIVPFRYSIKSARKLLVLLYLLSIWVFITTDFDSKCIWK